MQFNDATEVSGARITRDGYLVADAYVGKANNVQHYTAAELSRSDLPATQRLGILRPESAVFADASLASLAGRPITIDHPGQDVTAENWKRLAVGDVGLEFLRDGERLKVPLKIMDAAGIRAVKSTHQAFSLGYTAEIDWTPGIQDGVAYDGSLKDIRYNHLAATPNPRGGHDLRIVDENTLEPTMNTKVIIVDGYDVVATDASERVIRLLETKLADATTKVADATTAADTKIGELTGQIAVLNDSNAKLTTQLADAALTPEKMALAVAARTALVDSATKLLGTAFTDADLKLSDADLRKKIVNAKLGDAAANFTDAMFDGAFATIAAGVAGGDPVRQIVHDSKNVVNLTDAAKKAADARAKMIDGLTSGEDDAKTA